MTNNQKNQVAAMNASGMTIDEIVIDTGIDRQEVEKFVEKRNSKRKTISAETKQAVIEWYQSGHTETMCAKKFGISPASAHRIIATAKEKEPTAAATATDSDVKTLQVQDTTKTAESQVLRGVEMIGVMQSMLLAAEGDFGAEVDIMALKADSDTAELVFRYGGKAYQLSFGIAF